MKIKTKIEITNQGGPIANDAYILEKGDRVAAVLVDFETKYCEIFATGGNGENPNICIGCSENSLHYKEGLKDDITEISFPKFTGWNIFCAEFSRYSLYICFTKN